MVTENIRNAVQGLSIPYLRLARKTGAESAYEKVTFFPDNDSCVAALKEISGNILLTTGSKELSVYAKEEDVRKRLYVRILPGKEGIEACAREQISGRQVIAMQGPFSAQMNLAACLGESYQAADICSMHGKTLLNLAKRVQHAAKIYVLMSGVKDLHKLGKELLAAGLTDCRIYAGYQMSYPEQKILCLTPEECTKQEADGLYTCMIQNPHATPKMLTHGMSDEAFLRGRVPMTKEEVRQISICKLQLYEGAVVYDIGSGTGSIAMEIAALSPEVLVYAVERKAEALDLLRQNKAQMHLENVHIIEAEAPDGLRELPKATHAFIGGSGGHLAEILDALYDINPRMCVVINAISMETLVEIREACERYRNGQMELVQVQISRAHEVGAYHLMQAQNPVWICRLHFEANGRME